MEPLSTIVNKSLTKVIRDLFIDLGYFPDVRDETLYPKNSIGANNYNNALKQIELTKGFSLEIFGSNNPHQYGYKHLPRIIIHEPRRVTGDIGVPKEEYVREGELFVTKINSEKTVDFETKITIDSSRVKEEAFLNEQILSALGQFSYIPIYDQPTVVMFVEYLRDNVFINTEHSIRTISLFYMVKDLIIQRIEPEKTFALFTSADYSFEFNNGDKASFTTRKNNT